MPYRVAGISPVRLGIAYPDLTIFLESLGFHLPFETSGILFDQWWCVVWWGVHDFATQTVYSGPNLSAVTTKN